MGNPLEADASSSKVSLVSSTLPRLIACPSTSSLALDNSDHWTSKIDSLYGIIPADSSKIDNLSQVTPEQLRQLKDGIMVTDAMQQIRRRRVASAW
jgi:hypothetical protein